MTHPDGILPQLAQLASLGISPSRVLFINPELASAPLPPPSTSNNPCKPECPNLRSAVQEARSVARLQIDNARLRIRQEPLAAHVEQLRESLSVAVSVVTSYHNEYDRYGASLKKLFAVFHTMITDLVAAIDDDDMPFDVRVSDISGILVGARSQIDEWDREEGAARAAFCAGRENKEGVLADSMKKAPGYYEAERLGD